MIKSIIDIGRRVLANCYIDYNKDYRNSIFLAATGRSGSTWLSNIVNYKNEYRYIFEPFHPYEVRICRNFKYRQYLRPDNKDKAYIEPVRKILLGKVRNNWVNSQNKKLIANKRLIKDIRANLLLKWIHIKFPGIPIVLLLRHPCAVANSKLKLRWNTHLEEFLSQEELIEDFLNPFKKEINKAQSIFEKHVFLWCIENYIPLKQFRIGDIHLVFYENLCVNPEYEIKRLFLFLNKRFDEAIFSNLKKPSPLSRQDSAIITGGSLIDSWKKYITKEQIQRTTDILNIFGLDNIYSQGSMPNIENAFKMLGENTVV